MIEIFVITIIIIIAIIRVAISISRIVDVTMPGGEKKVISL